jgi:hypothetical protein
MRCQSTLRRFARRALIVIASTSLACVVASASLTDEGEITMPPQAPTTAPQDTTPTTAPTAARVKHVVLVGHCSPDSSHLTMVLRAAVPSAKITRVVDDAGVERALKDGADLLLVNRAMEHGYSEAIGTDYIRKLRTLPGAQNVKMMLISNYPDAQEAAVKEGALPGFGKSNLMTPETKRKLQDALK